MTGSSFSVSNVDGPSSARQSADRDRLLTRPLSIMMVLSLLFVGVKFLEYLATNPAWALLWIPAGALAIGYVLLYYGLVTLTHLAFAPALGFRVEFFALGPLLLVRDGKPARGWISTHRDFSRYWIVAPYSPTHQHRRTVFMLAGLTPVGALLAMAWAARQNMLSFGVHPLLVDLFPTTFAVIGGLAFIIYSVGMFIDSGSYAWIVRLEAEPDIHFLKDPAYTFVRPRDWPHEQVLAQVDDSGWAAGMSHFERLLHAYYHELDAGDIQQASVFIDRLRSRVAHTPRGFFPADVYPEVAYFMARYRENPEAARVWLQRGRTTDDNLATRLRAEAATHLVEGRYAESRRCALDAIDALHRREPTGLVEAQRDWNRQIIDAASEAAGAVEQEGEPST